MAGTSAIEAWRKPAPPCQNMAPMLTTKLLLIKELLGGGGKLLFLYALHRTWLLLYHELDLLSTLSTFPSQAMGSHAVILSVVQSSSICSTSCMVSR